MVRIDMSEYSEKHSVARLVGAPPGYVGYEEGGQLTEAVRRRPYCVVLFDEVEKAHPEVFDMLLQVLDDGRLTDGQGRTVDFRNTILDPDLQPRLAVPADPAPPRRRSRTPVVAGVRANFKPEFLNRLDDVILFKPLSTEELSASSTCSSARRARLAVLGQPRPPGHPGRREMVWRYRVCYPILVLRLPAAQASSQPGDQWHQSAGGARRERRRTGTWWTWTRTPRTR